MQEEAIQRVTDTIIREFKPEKVVLFGSYAWGIPGKDSDIDLLIVKNDANKSTREMAVHLERILHDREMPLDLLVYTPDQIVKRLGMGDQFITRIVHDGRVLYEQ